MITITCDQCGANTTRETADRILELHHLRNSKDFDTMGWILATAILFNFGFNMPFLLCKKCTGERSLHELRQDKTIDLKRFRLYKEWTG